MTLSAKIPRANLDEANVYQAPEFVQFYVDGEPYLRIHSCCHPLVIRSFVNECRMLGDSIVDNSEFEEAMRNRHGDPPRKIGRYEAVGFGFIENRESGRFPQKTAMFAGFSGTYNIRPDIEHLKKLSVYFPDWTLGIWRPRNHE